MSANPRLTALLHERAVLSKQAADVAQHIAKVDAAIASASVHEAEGAANDDDGIVLTPLDRARIKQALARAKDTRPPPRRSPPQRGR